MMDSEHKETKIPLGKELFASVNVWNGVPLVHIRHFETLISPFQPHTSLQVATKSGICMSDGQFRKLIVSLPSIVSELENLKASLANAENIPPPSTPSSSKKTPMRPVARPSLLNRAPTKPRPLLKRVKLGEPDEGEPLIKQLKLEDDGEPSHSTSDILARAVQSIQQ